jgi:hypothetical protein
MHTLLSHLTQHEPAGRQKQPAAENLLSGKYPAAKFVTGIGTYQHLALKTVEKPLIRMLKKEGPVVENFYRWVFNNSTNRLPTRFSTSHNDSNNLIISVVSKLLTFQPLKQKHQIIKIKELYL